MPDRSPPGFVNPKHPRFGTQPGGLRMYSVKGRTCSSTTTHSLMFRYAGQHEGRDAVTWTTNNDNREPDNFTIDAFSAVGQHSWVLGNNGPEPDHRPGEPHRLSRRRVEQHHRRALHARLPQRGHLPASLSISPRSTPAPAATPERWPTARCSRSENDVSLLQGNHSLKFGANFNDLHHLGILNGNEHFATLDVLRRPVGDLQQHQRPISAGLPDARHRRQWQQANGGAINGQGYWQDTINSVQQFSTWFQDDWRATPRLTLNLGVRYDVDFNLMDEKNHETNATRQTLEAIGHPAGGYPKTPKLDISPRVGFAYDLSGDGRRVLRGGYGLYFDQYNTAASAGDITAQARRPLNALATLTNTSIGVGQLATYRFGIDPLPPQPTEGNKLPTGSEGQWIDVDMVDPRTHQAHIGYAHALATNTTRRRRLHARGGTQREAAAEHQPDHQRPAPAGRRLPAGLRRSQLPLQREDPVGASTSRGTTR